VAYIDNAPRVAETSTTTGTGALALAAAYDASYRRFSAVCSTSDTVPYYLVADDNQWEHGLGTYSAANELTRTTVYESSNAGAACTLTAGSKIVFLGDPGVARSLLFAASKSTLTGADRIPVMDSADSNKLKHVSYTNLAAGLGGAPTSGGTVDASGSVTLTNASSQAHKLAFTAHGQYVKLADATTCTEGGLLHVLGNPTAYWGRILDSTSVLRGFVPPYSTVTVSLADNSTAAGGWVLDGSPLFGITAVLRTADVARNVRAQYLALDSTRTLIVFATGGTGTVSAVVHDSSDSTWGSVTAVRSGALIGPAFNSIILSTDFALVVTNDGSTAMEAVTLSISGKTITVNTAGKGTATLAGTIANIGDIVLLGSDAVVSYTRSTTTQAARAVTISGTAATIGAEVVIAATNSGALWNDVPHLYAVTSSVVLAIGALSSSSTGYAKPYTLSGSTLTLGTGTTFGTVTDNGRFRTLPMGSRWLVLWTEGAGGTSLSAALISMSGTTASLTSVTSVLTSLTASTNPSLGVDLQLISSSKALVTSFSGAAFRCNLLVDTAGTISKGTEYNPTLGSASAYTSHAIAAVSGTDARVYLAATAGHGRVITLDCSSTSPVISAGDVLSAAASPATPSYSKGSVRHPSLARCGGGWSFIQGTATTAVNEAVVVGATEVFPAPLPLPNLWQQQIASGFGTFNPSASISDYVTWQFNESNTNPAFLTFVKVEGAQP
jgi:hypothetical protein